jgi:hypothetical protein
MNKSEEFINKSKLKHGDKYDYSKANYMKAIEKVIIICKIHGEFEQTPNKHLHGNGCSKCFGQNKTTDDFIKEAVSIHKDKNNQQIYDYSKTIYTKASEKVIIICKIHGEFEQTPNGHLSGRGCSKCVGRNKTNIDFIQEAISIHKDINNQQIYEYSKTIYSKASKKVIIICKIHGEFKQTPNDHLSGNGCLKCGYIITANKKRSNKEEFIEKANLIHHNKYNYSLVEYINAISKVKIICDIHGNFEIQPNNHLTGQGCSECGKILMIKKQTYTKEQFEEYSNNKHNYKYDYSKAIYNKSNDNIIIICKVHGEFEQRPSNHLKGNGCPKCVGQNKTTEDFINDAIKIHWSDNNNKQIFDYSLVNYINARQKIIIICKEHGEFLQSPNAHLNQYM